MNAYIMSDGDFRDALVAAVIKYCGETGNEVKAVSEYGVNVPGLVQRGNVYGAQFHPEKSGPVGLKILRAFGEVTGAC